MQPWAQYLVCLFALGVHSPINPAPLVAAMSILGRSPPSTSPAPLSSVTVPTKCDPCPESVRCVPPIQCPAFVRMPAADRPQLCDLPGGAHGYCCTTGYNHTAHNKDTHSGHATISRESGGDHHHHPHQRGHQHEAAADRLQLSRIIADARSKFAHTLHSEKSLQSSATHLTSANPTFFHNLVFRSNHQQLSHAIQSTHRALERVFTARMYAKREHIPTVEFELNQVDAPLYGTPLENGCDRPAPCPQEPSRYRTMDGTCNNPLHSRWGAAGVPMERLLAPAYADGIWEPRTFGLHGAPLPNARTASRQLFVDVDRPHRAYNLLLMQFGQFITHDISHSSSITTDDGQSVSCCSPDGSAILPPGQLHWACLPISIEAGDEFYGPFGQRCLSLVRSALSVDDQCSLGYAKQLSKVTHYLDGSAIYGSDERTAAEVRSFRGGQLRVLEDFGRQLLPLTEKPAACGMERGPCFFAGDGRSNQIITLTALHTLFVREHNRVASALAAINPHWSDADLFAEARLIVVAQLQHIVYREWLPLVVGTETMERFGLGVGQAEDGGYSVDYDERVNAAVTSEFTTAAFRFGHSTVDGKFVVKNGPHVVEEIVAIPDVMFDSGRLRRAPFFDEILNTLTVQPMQQVDAAISKGLSGFLFRGRNPFGLDLAAINIQRGRDHGIRSYNDYLEATGHPRIQSFNEFGVKNAHKLRLVYAHPDDIDLWVGGLHELGTGDALLGVTFADIIADQFSRLRRGDRYFYELAPEINPGYLSAAQLLDVRQGASMARLLCDNADGSGLQSMAPRAFIRPDVPGNAPVSCADVASLGRMSLEPWRELHNYI